MATKTTKNTATQETKKEFKLEQAFALWKRKSKDGKKTYLSGVGENKRFTGFYNTKKQNPKEPDLRIYEVSEDGKLSKEEVASLWCNVSENTKKKYLTGKYNDKKVVGFINDGKNEKAPYLSVYYREEADEQQKIEIPETHKEEETDDDLPF